MQCCRRSSACPIVSQPEDAGKYLTQGNVTTCMNCLTISLAMQLELGLELENVSFRSNFHSMFEFVILCRGDSRFIFFLWMLESNTIREDLQVCNGILTECLERYTL